MRHTCFKRLLAENRKIRLNAFMFKGGLILIALYVFLLTITPFSYANDVSAEDLLNWETQSANPEILIANGIPLPPEKPPAPEDFLTRKRTIIVSGTDGPKMPAVPAGNIVIESIDGNAQQATPPDPLKVATTRHGNTIRQPYLKSTAQKDGINEEAEDQNSDMYLFAKLKKTIISEFKSIIDTAEFPEAPSSNIHSEGKPDQPQLETVATQTERSPEPEVQLPISEKRPYLSFVFDESGATDLTPTQRYILLNELKNLQKAAYQGQIRIFSYTPPGTFKNPERREIITNRAGKIRSLLLENGIDIRQLDVRAMPHNSKGERVELFLTGNS